jgi:large-conductance mechanosensitive channel
VGNILGYVIALAAGVVVGAAAVIALKSLTESSEEIEELSTVTV